MTFSAAIESLRTALVAYLENGDAGRDLPGVADSLARDPDDRTPAIYPGNKNQAPPVYPSITYRVNGAPDNSMRTQGQALAGTVIRLRMELEIWTGSADTGALAAISGPIEALLHNQGFALGQARCFRTLLTTCQPDLFDKTSNAWYGLFAYELHIQLP